MLNCLGVAGGATGPALRHNDPATAKTQAIPGFPVGGESGAPSVSGSVSRPSFVTSSVITSCLRAARRAGGRVLCHRAHSRRYRARHHTRPTLPGSYSRRPTAYFLATVEEPYYACRRNATTIVVDCQAQPQPFEGLARPYAGDDQPRPLRSGNPPARPENSILVNSKGLTALAALRPPGVLFRRSLRGGPDDAARP